MMDPLGLLIPNFTDSPQATAGHCIFCSFAQKLFQWWILPTVIPLEGRREVLFFSSSLVEVQS